MNTQVVVAQLAEWLLLNIEFRGPNPTNFKEYLFAVNCIVKKKIKKRRPQMDY